MYKAVPRLRCVLCSAISWQSRVMDHVGLQRRANRQKRNEDNCVRLRHQAVPPKDNHQTLIHARESVARVESIAPSEYTRTARTVPSNWTGKVLPSGENV